MAYMDKAKCIRCGEKFSYSQSGGTFVSKHVEPETMCRKCERVMCVMLENAPTTGCQFPRYLRRQAMNKIEEAIKAVEHMLLNADSLSSIGRALVRDHGTIILAALRVCREMKVRDFCEKDYDGRWYCRVCAQIAPSIAEIKHRDTCQPCIPLKALLEQMNWDLSSGGRLKDDPDYWMPIPPLPTENDDDT